MRFISDCTAVSAVTAMSGAMHLCLQVLSKRGVDIAFVGGSSSVLAAGGYCSAGGNIVLWDTLAPISGGPIAFLTHHTPLVTALQVVLDPVSVYL